MEEPVKDFGENSLVVQEQPQATDLELLFSCIVLYDTEIKFS